MFEQKIAQLNNERSRKKSYSVPEVQKMLKVERHTVYKKGILKPPLSAANGEFQS